MQGWLEWNKLQWHVPPLREVRCRLTPLQFAKPTMPAQTFPSAAT